MGQPDQGLGYLTELVFNVVVRGRPALPYQWTYYGGAALSFIRASIPSNFNPRNDGPGLSGVCLEVVCQEGDELWRDPMSLRRHRCVPFLVRPDRSRTWVIPQCTHSSPCFSCNPSSRRWRTPSDRPAAPW